MKHNYLPMNHEVTKSIIKCFTDDIQANPESSKTKWRYPLDESGTNFLPLKQKPTLTSHASINAFQDKIIAARKTIYPNNERHLFVDVDGVLNNRACLARGQDFDLHSLNVLASLCSDYFCKIYILSAGWSNLPWTKHVLRAFGLKKFEVVPYNARTGSKCISLIDFLFEHPQITNFVILEDESSEFFAFASQLYKIDRNVGLIDNHKKEILPMLE